MDRLFSFRSLFTLLLVSALFASWRSGTEEELAYTIFKVCNAHDIALQQPISNCNANGTNVTYNPNGPTMVPLEIHVANLVANGNGTYRLPNGVPDMYVEYDNLNGQIGTVGPVTTFYFETMANDEPVFKAIVDLPFDFLNPCGSLMIAAAVSNARVVNYNGAFYPIHDYSAPFEMFSCKLFHETCWDCSIDCLSGSTDPQADFYFCIDCAPIQLGGGKNLAQEDNQLSITKWAAEARTNPFQDRLVLDLSLMEATEVSVEVFTQTGVLAYQSKEDLEAGNQALSITTEKWQTGTYYCKVSSPHFSKTVALVKM